MKAKLVSVSKKITQKAGDDLFFLGKSLAGIFVKLKPLLKFSRSVSC